MWLDAVLAYNFTCHEIIRYADEATGRDGLFRIARSMSAAALTLPMNPVASIQILQMPCLCSTKSAPTTSERSLKNILSTTEAYFISGLLHDH
jgi:hypothetical protein